MGRRPPRLQRSASLLSVSDESRGCRSFKRPKPLLKLLHGYLCRVLKPSPEPPQRKRSSFPSRALPPLHLLLPTDPPGEPKTPGPTSVGGSSSQGSPDLDLIPQAQPGGDSPDIGKAKSAGQQKVICARGEPRCCRGETTEGERGSWLARADAVRAVSLVALCRL